MKYILRHVVHEHHWQRQLKELCDMVIDAQIDEVMLMEQSHQIMMVPFPLEKHQKMIPIYRQYMETLKPYGVDVSFNIATIVGHADAEIPYENQLPFQRFVGDNLKTAHAVYCIGDYQWQTYAEQVVSLYATLHPKRIMIDDDFRSLNHSQAFGCFCDTHVNEMKNRLGKDEFSAKTLHLALNGLSEDERNIKKLWMGVNFDFQLQAAQRIEKAIHDVDPNIQVGLMNSGELAHSLQGRDMNLLLEAFAGRGNQALSRPAGGAYQDGLHQTIVNMHQTSALSFHQVYYPTTWVSEIENWPHTRYLKSVATTRLQMLLHALWGADHLSFNLYDYLATPMQLEKQWISLLSQMKPFVNKIQVLRQQKELQGISLLYHQDIAKVLQNKSHEIQGIMPRRPLDDLLPQIGFPVQFGEGSINVLLGDDVLAYSQEDLMRLLGKSLIIDNIAAQHFIDQGLQSYLGISIDSTIHVPCVERLSHPDFSFDYHLVDLPTNWFRMKDQHQYISHLVPQKETIILSTYYDDNNKIISPAMTLFHNSLQGKVVVLAQPVQELGWLHRGRSAQLKALLDYLQPHFDVSLCTQNHVNVAPFIYVDSQTKETLYVCVNSGLDSEKIPIHNHENIILHYGQTNDDHYLLPPLGILVLSWKKK